jgi:hypothetical protein
MLPKGLANGLIMDETSREEGIGILTDSHILKWPKLWKWQYKLEVGSISLV